MATFERIVFLDIDGVLNTPRYVDLHGPNGIDPMRVDLLDMILDETGAGVVVSSSWRVQTESKENALGEIQEQLAKIGYMKNVKRVFDFTPQVIQWRNGWKSCDRGWEIDLWIRMNGWSGDFVVLDDGVIGLHGERLVRTDLMIGLTMSKAREAIEVLLLGRRAG